MNHLEGITQMGKHEASEGDEMQAGQRFIQAGACNPDPGKTVSGTGPRRPIPRR